jgi:hypothetical protein
MKAEQICLTQTTATLDKLRFERQFWMVTRLTTHHSHLNRPRPQKCAIGCLTPVVELVIALRTAFMPEAAQEEDLLPMTAVMTDCASMKNGAS